MSRPLIVHLVDDTNAGGVTRLLEHVTSAPELAAKADHRVQVVSRRRIGAPRIEADMIVSHLSVSWRSLPALMALRARNASVPLIHVEHSYTEGFVSENVPRLGRFMTLLRSAYSLFDRVISVSEAQAEWLADQGLVSAEALTCIPSFVDVGQFLNLKPVLNAPKEILAIGRLDRQKGFDILVQAFRTIQAPELRLRIVGDGPERAKLLALAKGDPRISFEGFTSDPVAAMARADAVAMPSRWEAYGLVALEARAAGRLLIAATIDGLRDHIRAGAIGVTDNDVDGWKRALSGLINRPDTLQLDVARARADAAANVQRFADRWNGLIAQLSNAKTGRVAA